MFLPFNGLVQQDFFSFIWKLFMTDLIAWKNVFPPIFVYPWLINPVYFDGKYYSTPFLKVFFRIISFSRGVATGEGGRGAMPPPSPTSIFKTKKVQQFQFQTSRYSFLWLLRNYVNQKFHGFRHVWYNFWLTVAFHFF